MRVIPRAVPGLGLVRSHILARYGVVSDGCGSRPACGDTGLPFRVILHLLSRDTALAPMPELDKVGQTAVTVCQNKNNL